MTLGEECVVELNHCLRAHSRPPGVDTMLRVAEKMVQASDGYYTDWGTVNDKNDYSADGAITDWAAGKLKVRCCVTFSALAHAHPRCPWYSLWKCTASWWISQIVSSSSIPAATVCKKQSER